MAINFVGADAFAGSDSDPEIVLPKPTGTVENNVLVALVQGSQSQNFSNPSGWTTLDTWDASTGVRLRTAYKVAGSSEPSSYTFTVDGDTSSASGTIAAFENVDTTSPVRESNTRNASFATSLSNTELNNTQSSDMVVILGGQRPENEDFNSEIVAPTVDSWNSPSAASSGPSDNDFGFPGSSDLAYQINGTTGEFDCGDTACGVGVAAVSLIEGTNEFEVSGTSTSISSTSSAATHDMEASSTSTSLSTAQGLLSAFSVLVSFPDYQFFIDWDSDGGLRLYDFINSTDGWEVHGTTPPSLSVSEAQAFSGDSSMLVDWQEFNPFRFDDASAGFDDGKFGADGFENTETPFTFDDADLGFDDGQFGTTTDTAEVVSAYITSELENLVIGKQYTFTMWMFPVNNHYYYEIGNLETSAETSTDSEWQEISVDFQPTSDKHTITVYPVDTPADGDDLYVDYVSVRGQFEEVVPMFSVAWDRGRDNSRALSPVTPAETELDFLNQDGRYAPANRNSVLYPNVESGRECLIRAVWENTYYDLFWGLLDNLKLNPETGEESATFNFVDTMAFLGQTRLDTAVYRGQRTGDAIDRILDEIGWPKKKRDIDAGATVIRWWWAYDVDASQAISDLVDSEGPPAYATLDPSGNFVFKDRHHRLVTNRSTTSQATLRGGGSEPTFSPPMDINLGWKDVLNSVKFEVTPRKGEPIPPNIGGQGSNDAGRPDKIWWHEDQVSIPVSDSVTFEVTSDDPFVEARAPVENPGPGFARPITHQRSIYTVDEGEVEVFLSRNSGRSVNFIIKNVGSTTAIVRDLALHAIPLVEDNQREQQVTLKDNASIERTNRESSHDLDVPWANIYDANAIASIVLGQRSNRLPTVDITMKGANKERMEQILNRRISDRIKIVEPRSFTNHEFFIEGIAHDITDAGKFHETVFSCEQIPVYDEGTTAFTFGDSNAGFDDGVFGYDGQSDPDTVFILGDSKLDEGFLGF